MTYSCQGHESEMPAALLGADGESRRCPLCPSASLHVLLLPNLQVSR